MLRKDTFYSNILDLKILSGTVVVISVKWTHNLPFIIYFKEQKFITLTINCWRCILDSLLALTKSPN